MSQITKVNAEGIHVKTGSTVRVAPLPQPLPDGATDVEWDAETMELSYTVPATKEGAEATTASISLTQTHLDDALAWTPPPAPPVVPESVSKAQLKLALLSADIDLAALIAGLPADKQAAAQILIDDAQYFTRAAPMVNTLGEIAGMTPAQVDDLFIAAAAIDPATL